MKWELAWRSDSDTGGLKILLDAGWEPYAVVSAPGAGVIHYFRRPTASDKMVVVKDPTPTHTEKKGRR